MTLKELEKLRVLVVGLAPFLLQILAFSAISPPGTSERIPALLEANFNLFVEGLPYPTVLLFFLIEGVGWLIALTYFYHRFIRGGRRFSVPLFKNFEEQIIDRGYNEKVVAGVSWAGQALLKLDRGDINTYLLWIVLGLLAILAGIIIML